MEEKNARLVKDGQLSKEEVSMLREKFIATYSKKMGWNPKELSTAQMLEIASQREYKTPNLILG